MNRTHRVIWSQALGAFVVTHEHAKTAGKSCKVLRGAVALVLGSLASEMATAACSPGIAVSGDGSSHIVNAGRVCDVPIGVLVTQATVASGLTNSGSIQAGSAITIAGSTLGNILNTGTIHGQFGALTVNSSTLTGSFKNKGTLTVGTSAGGAVYFASGTHLAGGVVNNGLIESSEGPAIHLRDSSIGANGIANVGGTLNAFTGISLTSSSVAGGIRNSGVITGQSRGISLLNANVSGDIKNTGSIAGSSAIAIVDSRVKGSVINFAQGLVTGISDSRNAIEVSNSTVSGVLRNNGTVTSADHGLVLANSVLRGGLVNYGGITGAVGSVLISHSNLAGGILNAGTLDGGQGLVLDHSTINGSIVNDGTIQGGILIEDHGLSFGGLVNNGLVAGGIQVHDSLVDGGFLNTGTLTGDHLLAFSNSTVIGTISNAGTLASNADALSFKGGLIYGNLINTGVMTGATHVLSLTSATLIGRLSNKGTLSSPVQGVTLVNSTIGGGITNSVVITGGSGALELDGMTVNGLVRNTGLISATGTEAVGLAIAHSTLSGGVSNAGTISGMSPAVQISASQITGDIKNTGTLSGIEALRISDTMLNGNLSNAGLIRGGSQGINLTNATLTGGLYNSGTVNALGGGALQIVGSSIAGNIINSGLFKSGTVGITVLDSHITGGLFNSGTFNFGTGVSIRRSTLGQIANSGTIHGGTAGLGLVGSTISGAISNSGSLTSSASGPQGLSLSSGTVVLGALVNSGTIAGGQLAYGIELHGSTIVGGLTNSGTIGGANSIRVDATSRLDTLVITGNDTARFDGRVEAPNTHASVAQGAIFTLLGDNVFHVADFANNGTLGVAAQGFYPNEPDDPGHPGRATLAGNYTQASNATFVTHVLDDGNYGKLVVTGTASLPDQAKIYVDASDTAHAFTTASLNNVISAGTLQSNGTFNVTSNSQLFQFAGVKDANTVDLAISAKAANGVSAAVAPTSRGAARVLDAQFASASASTLTPYFVSATNNSQVANAVAQTLPLNSTLHTSQTTVANINNVVQSRIDANTGLASGDGFYGDNTLWMKPFGAWVDQNGRNGATGYNANIWGMVFGADGVLSENTRLGVSFAYAKASTDSDNQAARQSADIDLYQLTGYGSYSLAPDTELSVHAGMGQNHNDGRRDIDLAGSNSHAKANFDSLTASAGMAVAKVFTLNDTTLFTPSVRADYSWIRDEGYHEKGSTAIAPLLLDVDARKTDQLILGLDGKLSHQVLPGTRLTANLGVGYDVLHENDSITSSYAGASGQSFTTQGLDPSPWLARSGIGLATQIASGAQVSVNYDVETRSDFNEQTASIKVSVPF